MAARATGSKTTDDQLATLRTGVATVVTEAARLAVIVTREDAQAAGLFLRGVRTRIRAIEAHYKPIRAAVRRKVAEALEEIKTLEMVDLQPWELANERLTKPLEDWIRRDREETEAANRRALADAEARAHEERERQAATIRAAAAAAQTASLRKSLERQATRVEKSDPLPVFTAVAEQTKIDGISTPTRRTAEVTDLAALISAVARGRVSQAALVPAQDWLDAQATTLGKDMSIPGVVVREDISLTARGV